MTAKRFYDITLDSKEVTFALVALIREFGVTAIRLSSGKILYIVEGEARFRGFKERLHALVGSGNFREYLSPPGNVSVAHAKDAAKFLPSPPLRPQGNYYRSTFVPGAAF